jgi:glutamate synthase (NADPH/NADH) large chain/glutamate synthase (ferredoxin)
MASEAEWSPSNLPPLYNPAYEHDGCGTGFIARIDGERTHEVVELAVTSVANLTHRGAVSADAKSGDGAGVTIQVPRELLAEDAAGMGMPESDLPRLAVAMVFLPGEEEMRDRARAILEAAVVRTGIVALGWRIVPTDQTVLGESALESLPGIEQMFIERPSGMSTAEFDRALYLARGRAEAGYRKEGTDCYIVSMSARTVVYKGLMVATQLARFFTDLEDERTVSAIALFHQRFATNTLPTWSLAQPFRLVAHNGEINTLLGNRNWMSAREPELTSGFWGDQLEDLIPVIHPIGSDTASLDEAFELLATSGRGLLHSMAMLIPEAWESMPNMDPQLREFYEYHACLTEPWDGPAAVAFTDGTVAATVMDRNGLRPARYQVTSDGIVIMSSEVGLADLPLSEIVESGRVGPGEMIAVDTARRQFLHNDEIKAEMAGQRPYGEWVGENLHHLDALALDPNRYQGASDDPDLIRRQALHGYTQEEIGYVLTPMGRDGKEPTGSMGDDTPPSMLNGPSRLLYTYFRQRFAQVTNPPIDSLREKIVMSLDTYLGRRHSILEEDPTAARLVHLKSPIMSEGELVQLREGTRDGFSVATLEACFPVSDGTEGLERALDDLCTAASAAVVDGCQALVISDRSADESRAPIPMLLAVSTVHYHLIREGLRMRASIVAEAGDARDVHHLAALIGFGASAVCPYLAFETLGGIVAAGDFEDMTLEEVIRNYRLSADAGVLKVMSKMGISAVSSYHGAQIFEVLGLNDEVIERSFSGTTSRIGGIGFDDIAADVIERHERAYSTEKLDRGGWYKFRRDGDYHANGPQVWRALHKTVQGGGEEEYRAYRDLVHSRPPTALRDLLDFSSDREPIELDRVEAVTEILPRFQTGAMSLGALSPEAHEDLARAMNRMGARANTGEGGEDPRRYTPDGDKLDANSAVKQVASGRFGVTPAYLVGAEELEIKIAQGAKPGEGGQLPGHKVSAYIAGLRHVSEGTPLISPPPHHDIYSIEDIAQLIYDLKVVNPRARIIVKLVASEGVGTIAAGLAKAYADVIQISGADGGTGASPLTSLKYAGGPWELGLAETQQTLMLNGLRGRVILSTDGGLHTGRDVVIAALLGAERYGFGTTALIAIGCKMARQCHLNTCPVGIATQAEELREKYFGTPEMLIQFLTHVGEEVREILASLGYERLDDLVGRADLLGQIASEEEDRWHGVDLSKLIAKPSSGPAHVVQERNDRPGSPLDDRILEDIGSAIEDGGTFQGSYEILNRDRTVGGRISGHIAQVHGDAGLPPGSIDLIFRGSAGQSFGAWLASGMRLNLVGEANDYVAKGMNGGEITVCPPPGSRFLEQKATLVGNTVLYGATGGDLFVSGGAGERFGVRNSGGRAVVEGVGDHACEYMTGGVVVIIGDTGRNLGAGMSNGLAYVLDEFGDLPPRVNHDLVEIQPVELAEDVELLKTMIERHYERTGSRRAQELLGAWEESLPKFRKVAPRDVPDPMSEVRHHIQSLREEMVDVDVSVPVQASHDAPTVPSLTTNP